MNVFNDLIIYLSGHYLGDYFELKKNSELSILYIFMKIKHWCFDQFWVLENY